MIQRVRGYIQVRVSRLWEVYSFLLRPTLILAADYTAGLSSVLLSVFTVGAGWISGLFRCPLAVRLGDVSFECYLIHQIILNVYSRGIGAAELSQPGKAVSFLTCLLATVVFALFLNRPKHKNNRK